LKQLIPPTLTSTEAEGEEGKSALISIQQIKPAHRLLGWTQSQLSRNSGVSENSIQRYEKGLRRALGSTLGKIERTLEAAGVEFVDGGGVKLKTKGKGNPSSSTAW
jgi:transcriptional regulator with XRE-family HTH domain